MKQVGDYEAVFGVYDGGLRIGQVKSAGLMDDTVIMAVWAKYPDIEETNPGWTFKRNYDNWPYWSDRRPETELGDGC